MKKLSRLCLPVLLLLLCLGLGITGCASGGSTSDEPADTPQNDNPQDMLPPPQPSVNIFINNLESACLPAGTTELSAYVSVIDEMGNLIDTLNLSNFQITQDSTLVAPASVQFATSDDLIPAPISATIIMDYSKSITDLPDVQAAMEDAVDGFIDLMQLGDQAEIIKFNTGIKYLLPFTSDKSLLKAGVAYMENVGGGYTYLYDTLYTGIEDVALQNGRKAVIAITDGRDYKTNEFPGDGRDVEEVIALAKTNNIPLFLIGLGADINVTELQEMAEETSGHFYQAASSNDLEDIYTNISDLLNIEQYLMVFEAEDNGTPMSTVTVSVNYNNLTDAVSASFPYAICP